MTSFTSRYGNPAIDCGGAHLWAHERHGCVVLAVSGRVGAGNVEDIVSYAYRHIGGSAPFVLDLSGVTDFDAAAAALPKAVDERCAVAGVEWALVAAEPVLRRLRGRDGEVGLPLIDSVAHAEHQFDDAVTARRRLLLPLLRRTA